MAGRVVILGGGSTGEAFAAALRRLDREAPITLVEQELVGGECSYFACIPSKTMLRPVEALAAARLAPGAAEAITGALDAARVFWWRDQVVDGRDDSGQARWLAGRDVELVRGTGRVLGPGRLAVGERELTWEKLVIATGSVAEVPPIPGLAEARYWTSREATTATEVPESLLVLGGGAVGCELAQLYHRLGSRVVLVEALDRLVPRADPAAGRLLQSAFEEEGLEVRVGARAEAVEPGVRVRLSAGEALEAARLLVATGRKANFKGFGFETLGLALSPRGIEVDERLRAGENVWAIGDVTGVALFTHVGKYQARVAALDLAGREARADYRAIPATIFTDPQVAFVGRTEGEGLVTSEWKLEATSRTGTYERPRRRGLVKVFADPKRRVLVGALAVGPEAGEWLQQLTLAIRAEVPIDVLRDTIQPYPTFSEAIFFALRDLPLPG